MIQLTLICAVLIIMGAALDVIRWVRYKNLQKQLGKTKELIHHAYIHASYPHCGFNQMTTEQKKMFADILRENDMHPDFLSKVE